MRLLDFLFPPREDERVIRDVSVDEFSAKLAPALIAATRPTAVGLLPFSDAVVRAAVHEAKYHGSVHAFALLAGALADFLPDYLNETRFDLGGKRSNPASLVPVPLGPVRRKERGYNQVEEVARYALRRMSEAGLDMTLDTALLTRTRETSTQISLTRAAREANMQGAFAATAPAHPAQLYIVLDDVLTTGATLQACIDALVAAGTSPDRILPIALAH